jgi:putative ABC transport system ATP-binding protein
VGQSGSGKSTLLSLLGGLDAPTAGSIIVDGRNVAQMPEHELVAYRCRKIGFVFQSYNLVPNLTAFENVCLPMEFADTPIPKRIARAKQLLAQVGLTDAEMRRKPSRLSGGQQQRTAIARALANHPALILADEPTGNLDSQNSEKIFNLLRELARSENTTILVVTHDLANAARADVTFRLQDGKVVQASQEAKK